MRSSHTKVTKKTQSKIVQNNIYLAGFWRSSSQYLLEISTLSKMFSQTLTIQ